MMTRHERLTITAYPVEQVLRAAMSPRWMRAIPLSAGTDYLSSQ
jgi:hypothetical protein